MKKKIKLILLILILGLITYFYREYSQIGLKIIIKIQKKLIPLISKNFKNEGKVWLGIIFLWCYGVFHSIGPGHGKSIILSLTLSNKISLKKIIILAGIMSYLQGLSVLFIYKLFILIGKKIIPILSFNLEQNTRNIVAVILIILGIYLIYKEFKDENYQPDETCQKNIYFSAFIIGIIPCSGILNILFFLKLLKMERYGFISAMCICSGMFFTIILTGILSDFIKDKILKNKKKRKFIKYIGFLLIIMYGFITIIKH